MEEKRERMGEQKASSGPKWLLVQEQSSDALISEESRVGASSGKLYTYLCSAFKQAWTTKIEWLFTSCVHNQ